MAKVATVPYALIVHLHYQIRHLAALGADLTLISSKGPELSQLAPHPGIRHISTNIPRRLAPIQDLFALLRLLWIFHKQKFTMVHSVTPKAGLLTAVAAKLAGVPIRLHTFTGQPWATLYGPIRFLSRIADKLIGRLNTRCYADSPSQRDFLVQEHIVGGRKIKVIGAGSIAGIDLIRFDRNRFDEAACIRLRTELGIPQQAPVVAFIGRITRDKGITELLDAFALLKESHRNPHLLLVGQMDEMDSRNAMSLRERIAANPKAHWVGYSEVPERYLAISAMLCLPSYREGFGTSVIEAGAMGLPTVGTRINGLVDAVVDGKTGILVEPRNAVSLFQALKRLLDDPELAASMGRQAQTRCAELFDARIVNDHLASEYVSLLAGGRPSPG